MKRVPALLLGLAVFVAAPGVHARGHSCHEVSEVVGLQQCTRYGRGWTTTDAPVPLWGDASFVLHVLPLSAMTFGASPAAGAAAIEVQGSRLGRAPALLWGSNQRIGLAFTPWLYGALESSIAYGSAPDATTIAMSASELQPQGLLYLGGSAVVGAALTRGRFTGRLEIAAGARLLQLSAQQFSREQSRPVGLDSLTLDVQPRAEIDVWLGSGFTLGAWGGAEIATDGSVGASAGLSLVGHLRVFDGARGR